MKLPRLLPAIAIFLAGTAAQAQQTRGTAVKIVQQRIAKQADSVYLDFDISTATVPLKPGHYFVLTPVIQAEGRSKYLKPVLINGSKRQKLYNRGQALDTRSDFPASAFYSVLSVKNARHAPLRYTAVVPYEDWMNQAALMLENESCGCGNTAKTVDHILISSSIRRKTTGAGAPANLSFRTAVMSPEPAAAKTFTALGESYFDFETSQSELLPSFRNNTAELNKINRTISSIRNNPYAVITNIYINGFASIDGPFPANSSLAADRAKALRSYLLMTYRLDPAQVSTAATAEDWSRLQQLITESDMNGKEQLTRIINSDLSGDEKEQRLKAIDGGRTYAVLLKEFFPKLRRSTYTVHYTVAPYSTAQALELAVTHPELLSLPELMDAARSYPAGSDEYNQLAETTVKLYPDEEAANINAAAAALSQKNLLKAYGYLERFRESPHAANNLGVLYLLQGDYVTAEGYLSRVKDTPEAQYNLQQISLRRAQQTQSY